MAFEHPILILDFPAARKKSTENTLTELGDFRNWHIASVIAARYYGIYRRMADFAAHPTSIYARQPPPREVLVNETPCNNVVLHSSDIDHADWCVCG
jgi:hypothetical protein